MIPVQHQEDSKKRAEEISAIPKPPSRPPGPPPSRPGSRWNIPPPSAPAEHNQRRSLLVPEAPPRTPLTPDINNEVCGRDGSPCQIDSLRASRNELTRSHYLVTSRPGSSSFIPPHFSLQSALMELSDAKLEADALHARSESTEASLVRTQEDAFAYTAAASATERT